VKKVDRQFDQLKSIIDDQKKNAENTIKNLESVLEYKPPPNDLAKETLSMLSQVKEEIEKLIEKHKSMSTKSSQFFNILQEQGYLTYYNQKAAEFAQRLKNHHKFMQDNARPVIEVRCEIDKFRGFLHDVLSFEPDFILQSEKPRLHYFDEQLKVMLVHELATQNTT